MYQANIRFNFYIPSAITIIIMAWHGMNWRSIYYSKMYKSASTQVVFICSTYMIQHYLEFVSGIYKPVYVAMGCGST